MANVLRSTQFTVGCGWYECGLREWCAFAWEGGRGEFEEDGIPESIQRLIFPDAVRTYDRSTCGYHRTGAVSVENNNDDEQQNPRIIAEGEAVSVNELPLSQFRAMLIEHFNICFHESKIIWPKRLSKKNPPRQCSTLNYHRHD